MKKHISLNLEPEILDNINQRRGLAPLSTYIEAMLKEALEIIEEGEKGA